MNALKDMPISFPGLFGDWSFNPDPIAVHIGHGIYWYGIILAAAMLAGLFLAMKQAKNYGLTEDNVLDFILWAVPCCILGSRIYYVVFYLDLYRTADGGLDWGRIVAIWDGGLAIYGTVIAGALTVLVFTRVKKLRFAAMTDLAVLGLFLGQIIGRWANFINREAFGGPTDLPWRMRLWVSAAQSVDVHPTFLYESLWNLAGLLLLLFVVSKGRRFDGENTWFYFLWYGLGRAWVEGLRTDSLYLFDWTLFGQPIRVSQALSLVMAAVAAFMLFYNIRIKKRTADGLLVNQLRRQAQEAEEAAEAGEPDPAPEESQVDLGALLGDPERLKGFADSGDPEDPADPETPGGSGEPEPPLQPETGGDEPAARPEDSGS